MGTEQTARTVCHDHPQPSTRLFYDLSTANLILYMQELNDRTDMVNPQTNLDDMELSSN
jgi:hypothetical protein